MAFGGVAATSITSDTAATIVATCPAGTGTVDVTVTTPSGPSALSLTDKFTYVPKPAVTAVTTTISPASGPLAGGTQVTISGTDLANFTAVKFGSTAATSIISKSATSIVLKSPAHAAGPVDVTVTTVGGTSTASGLDQFTYVAAPTVISITPTAGPLGTQVTITGTNLLNFTAVDFGTTAAATFGTKSATEIVVYSPLSSGTVAVDVTVATAGGTSHTSSRDKFRFATTAHAPAKINSAPLTPDINGLALLALTGQSSPSATIQRKMIDNLMLSPLM